jgi:hypothetical protein
MRLSLGSARALNQHTFDEFTQAVCCWWWLTGLSTDRLDIADSHPVTVLSIVEIETD